MTRLTFIIAVSGGVDSVVLLDMLATRKNDIVDYVVAHFDHGIREDSHEDAKFVADLAEKYGFKFELGNGNLGTDCSEANAREARYEFLRSVAKKHKAEKIITAHHQDDLVETMIINIIRGTGPRGLAPMRGTTDILRPLLSKRKSELVDYAKKNNLSWHEDSTNSDMKYLRNYVRKNIMPKISNNIDDLLIINKRLDDIYHDIDMRISSLTPTNNSLNRPEFVNLPYCIQCEIMRSWTLRLGLVSMDRLQIEKLVIAVKTLPVGKKIDCGGKHWMISFPKKLTINPKNVDVTPV